VKRYRLEDIEMTVIAAEGNAHVSRNAIQVLDDGTWVVMYNKANNHQGSEWSHVNLRFSADHGRTWTKENHHLDGTPLRGIPCGNPDNLSTSDPWLYVAPNGDLVIHFWRVEWRTATWKGTWAVSSSDGGRTWSAPEQVHVAGVQDDNLVFAGEGDFCVDGIIYAGFREFGIGKPRPVLHPVAARCFLAQSKDNCKSWELLGYASDWTDDCFEASYEYLGDGKILCVVNGSSRKEMLQVNYVTYSDDMGRTWSDLESITAQTTGWHRPRIYTRKRLRGEEEWWDDDIIIGTGTKQDFLGEPRDPRINSVWVSPDRGRSWTSYLALDEPFPDAGYGDLAYDPDEGKYVVIMYNGTNEEAVLKQYRFRIMEGKKAL